MERIEYGYGLNGLGQIGGTAFRLSLERRGGPGVPIGVINEFLPTDDVFQNLPDLLPEKARLERDGDVARIFLPNGPERRVRVFNWKTTDEYRWGNEGVHSVIDASPKPEKNAAGHVAAGADEVLLTGPSEKFPEILRGINEYGIRSTDRIFSNGSCTTKASAPILKKILNAVRGDTLPSLGDVFLTGTHAGTNTDTFVDRVGKPGVADNMIGGATGASQALQRVFTELNGKLHGTVVRVPTSEGSIVNVHCTFEDRIARDREAAHSLVLKILRETDSMDPTVYGIDDDEQPDTRSHRNDRRPSVLLSKLVQVGERSAVIPARYNNVLGSAYEALLTIKRIREIRRELLEAVA